MSVQVEKTWVDAHLAIVGLAGVLDAVALTKARLRSHASDRVGRIEIC